MRLHIKNLINKHKNVPCVVVGSGPTMADFDYKNFKGIIIAIGTSIYRFPPKIINKINIYNIYHNCLIVLNFDNILLDTILLVILQK